MLNLKVKFTKHNLQESTSTLLAEVTSIFDKTPIRFLINNENRLSTESTSAQSAQMRQSQSMHDNTRPSADCQRLFKNHMISNDALFTLLRLITYLPISSFQVSHKVRTKLLNTKKMTNVFQEYSYS